MKKQKDEFKLCVIEGCYKKAIGIFIMAPYLIEPLCNDHKKNYVEYKKNG